MPFIDSAQSLKARLHLSEASTPVLVGIVALALIAIVLVCQNIIGAYSGAGFSPFRTNRGHHHLRSRSRPTVPKLPIRRLLKR